LPFFKRSARLSSASKDGEPEKPPVERRKFQRWPVRSLVTFRNLTQGGSAGSAYIEDISQGGLRLTTQSAVDVGDAVSCELEWLLLMGEVIHCRNFGLLRVVGIKLAHNLDKVQLQAALDLFWNQMSQNPTS